MGYGDGTFMVGQSYGKVSYCFLGDMLENTDLQVTSDLYLCDQVMGHVH